MAKLQYGRNAATMSRFIPAAAWVKMGAKWQKLQFLPKETAHFRRDFDRQLRIFNIRNYECFRFRKILRQEKKFRQFSHDPKIGGAGAPLCPRYDVTDAYASIYLNVRAKNCVNDLAAVNWLHLLPDLPRRHHCRHRYPRHQRCRPSNCTPSTRPLLNGANHLPSNTASHHITSHQVGLQ